MFSPHHSPSHSCKNSSLFTPESRWKVTKTPWPNSIQVPLSSFWVVHALGPIVNSPILVKILSQQISQNPPTLIYDHSSQPLPSFRWCLITLACLIARILLGWFSKNLSLTLMVPLSNFPPCFLAINPPFSLLYSEWNSTSIPNCETLAVFLISTAIVLNKVCLSVL